MAKRIMNIRFVCTMEENNGILDFYVYNELANTIHYDWIWKIVQKKISR